MVLMLRGLLGVKQKFIEIIGTVERAKGERLQVVYQISLINESQEKSRVSSARYLL